MLLVLGVGGLFAAADSSRGISRERQNILAEMWQRRILPTDAAQWTPEDMALLRRLRNAEAAGAFSALKARFGGLKGMAAPHRPAGSSETRLRLTKEGYDRYLRLRTQQALEYFEKKGVDAKWGFRLKDLQGRALFDSGGLLSEAGEDLYNRVLANREARWQAPNGEMFGNRPPKPFP